MDLYFLRKVIDNEEITHGIVYTGINHSVIFIYTLVKYFGFHITHSNHLHNNLTLKDYEDIIKNEDYSKKIRYLFFPKKFNQCVDMSHFPNNLK